jgi:hypothetical protein
VEDLDSILSFRRRMAAQRRISGHPSPSPLYSAGSSTLAAARGDEEEREAEPDGGVFSGSFPTAGAAVVAQ